MENTNYQALELHKILEMLSAKCTVPKSRELALEIEPQTDIDTVKEEIAKTGVPMLILDGDALDRRNSHDGQIRTRLEAFLEMIDQGVPA